MSITNRTNDNDKMSLGQFLTPTEIVQKCLSQVKLDEDLIVEPSCGNGSFLKEIKKKNIIGVELDKSLLEQYNGGHPTINKNFYDVCLNDLTDKPIKTIHFIGNPPYRSPAQSISTHKNKIKELRKEYDMGGIREEACLFLLMSLDIIVKNKLGGKISYILPESIFKNNSRVFTKFSQFINKYFTEELRIPIENFPGVSTPLIFISWKINDKPKKQTKIVNKDIITFQEIFKKTYLGSVPCESIFLSCQDESRHNFKKRLQSLYIDGVDKSNLIEKLSYNGKPHLRALQQNSKKDIERINDYVQEFKKICELEDVENCNNYKEIQHRKEIRFYFRCDKLKKASFVYQINPNPGPSFYFPGNPTSTSPDYYGYCGYDVNRNSCAGALRCVLIDDVENNIQEDFLKYWKENTKKPITDIFKYLEFVINNEWYKSYKKNNSRFYFCVPKVFTKEFIYE